VKPVGDNRPVPERGAQIGCPADFVILLSSQDQHGDHQVGDDFFDKINAKLGQQNPPVSPVTQHRKSDRCPRIARPKLRVPNSIDQRACVDFSESMVFRERGKAIHARLAMLTVTHGNAVRGENIARDCGIGIAQRE